MIPLPVVDALDSITIPVNCPVPWDEMHGNSRTRFCDKCGRNVHNLAEMTAAEAAALLDTEASVCVRLERLADGRVLTSDTPLNRRERIWRWMRRRAAWAAAVFAPLFLAGCGGGISTFQGTRRDYPRAK